MRLKKHNLGINAIPTYRKGDSVRVTSGFRRGSVGSFLAVSPCGRLGAVVVWSTAQDVQNMVEWGYCVPGNTIDNLAAELRQTGGRDLLLTLPLTCLERVTETEGK